LNYDLSLRWFLIYKAIKPALLFLLLHHQLFLDLFDIRGPYELSNPLRPLLDHTLPLLLHHPSLFHHLFLLLMQHLILPHRQLLKVVPCLKPFIHTAILVQIEVVDSFLKNQRVHVVRGLLQSLVERGQHVLRGQFVLERGLTRVDLLGVEGFCLGY
jgi:hypothetical protein